MRQDIAWSGITRATADGICPDGECAELVNLISENGSLWPALEAERVYDFGGHTDRRLVYVHRNQGYENWLSYDNKRLFFEATEENGSIKPGPYAEEGIMDISTLVRIEAIGNTLVVFSGDKKEYLLYKDGNYVHLGEMPPVPEPSVTINVTVRETKPALSELNPDPPRSYLTDGTPWQGEYAPNIKHVTDAVFSVVNQELARSRQEGNFVFPFFLRYALRLYDGSYIYQSAPMLIATPANVRSYVSKWSGYEGDLIANFDFVVQIFEIHLRYSLFYILKGWEDIVKGIDFFASEPVWTFDQNGYIDRFEYRDSTSFLKLPAVNEKIIREKLESTGVFYKVHSLELTEEETYSEDIVMQEGGLDNLIFQPQLPDDYNSHCRLTGRCSYVYNSKLHLADLSQDLFTGFIPFKAGEGEKSAARQVEVSWLIKTEGGNARVCRRWGVWPQERILCLKSFIYYPDARAYQMVITLNESYTQTIALKPHGRLNGAYALLDRQNSYVEFDVKSASYDHTPYNTTVYYPNKMQVSELNNPFTFPVNQIYTVGTGKITGLAAATKALSQGQFGQFPLYVFSEDGIWSMEVGGSAYSVRTPVTRDVCVSPSSVISLDSAVVFASDKGLMVLEGSQVGCLSESLSGPSFQIDSQSDLYKILEQIGIESILHNTSSGCRFSDYLKNASVGYDYTHSRLLICREADRYSYIYNLKTGIWSKIQAVYSHVLNAYPECYVSNSKGVHRLSLEPPREEAGEIPVCLISRPLKLGDAGVFKRLQRLALRLEEYYGKKLAVIVCASRDGYHYCLLKSWKGARAQHVGGSGFRYFIVTVAGTMDARCALHGISVETEASMGSKLR